MDSCPTKHTPHPTGVESNAVTFDLWRSLEEFAQTPDFRACAEREFPALASELRREDVTSGFVRRRFLQLMGASMGLAGMIPGLTGCRRPDKRIVPVHAKPEEIVPGKPLYYTTTFDMGGIPIGMLAETHDGRPTKLEGHPDHPMSGGALTAFAQASVLDLYDPDRSRLPLRRGKPLANGEDAAAEFAAVTANLREKMGRGFAILARASSSPTRLRLRRALAVAMPESTWHEYEPLQPWASGARPAGPTERFHLGNAKRILALDCDFLGLEGEGTRLAREFARGRTVENPGDEMNRLYVVEPHLTVTGGAADHRLRLRSSQVLPLTLALAKRLLPEESLPTADIGIEQTAWNDAVAEDLREHRGRCAVLAGARQPEAVRELVRRINRALGNEGKTIDWRPAPESAASLDDLAAKARRGEVETLLILGGDPAYDAPSDLEFASLIGKIPATIHHAVLPGKTAPLCSLHLPATHFLESWGDGQIDGLLSPAQPMIEPLFGGVGELELLATLAGEENVGSYDQVRATFSALVGEENLEANWRQFLHRGMWPLDQALAEPPAPRDLVELLGRLPATPESVNDRDFEVVFAASAATYDGRFANNGWLQEAPDPVTKLTWDNALLMAPADAEDWGVVTGDVVALTMEGKDGASEIEAPVCITPGTARGSLALSLGHGQRHETSGSLARHSGFDAYALRTTAAPWIVMGVTLAKRGRKYPLACTQDHWSIEQHELVDGTLKDRALIREGALARFEESPEFAKHMGMHVPHHQDMFQAPPFEGMHQWAMTIDLNKCTGCNACVTACQAENNIPLVGKDEVIKGREMHWIRLDRYFRGEDPRGDVAMSLQPMLCQHCENAPCEQVCPVNATVHDHDGLNAMVYNRCIGTRYCANNCPYKVRRFNFFDYNTATLRTSNDPFDGKTQPNPTDGFSLVRLAQRDKEELLKMQMNPDVSVRMRGVMEKCTFCTQRIQQAKLQVKIDAGQSPAPRVADGVVKTACQQSCPTEAIVFGDIANPDSAVSKSRENPREYAVLEHLNVRPRVTYLARLRNLNPAIPAGPLAGMMAEAEKAHPPAGHVGTKQDDASKGASH